MSASVQSTPQTHHIQRSNSIPLSIYFPPDTVTSPCLASPHLRLCFALKQIWYTAPSKIFHNSSPEGPEYQEYIRKCEPIKDKLDTIRLRKA